MSTHLPAPYENAPDDDLAGASLATLAAGAGALTAITVGSKAWPQFSAAVKALEEGARASKDDVATIVTAAGWAVGAVFLALGAIALMLRRGRRMLAFGALVSVATTLIARYSFDWFTAARPVPNAAMYYGGLVVLALLIWPAVGRWAHRRPIVSGLPPLLSASTIIAPAAPLRHR